MGQLNSFTHDDDGFADRKLLQILHDSLGGEFPPESLGLLPKYYRLVSMDCQKEDERNVRLTATIYYEGAVLRVCWVVKESDARPKVGEIISPRWPDRVVYEESAIRICSLVPVERPDTWLNLFRTIPFCWVDDRSIVRRAAMLVDALPLIYRHLFNAIFWDGERFKRFCTLQLFRYGHHAETEGCLNHAVLSAERMRESCKVNGDASVSLCILLGLLHDAGKAGEYYRSEDGRWAPTSRGKLLWHKAIILDWIADARARWNLRLPEKLYMALIHCLVSSSHMPEWMGAKDPQLPEARLLSQMERPSGIEELLRRTAMIEDQMLQQAIRSGEFARHSRASGNPATGPF